MNSARRSRASRTFARAAGASALDARREWARGQSGAGGAHALPGRHWFAPMGLTNSNSAPVGGRATAGSCASVDPQRFRPSIHEVRCAGATRRSGRDGGHHSRGMVHLPRTSPKNPPGRRTFARRRRAERVPRSGDLGSDFTAPVLGLGGSHDRKLWLCSRGAVELPRTSPTNPIRMWAPAALAPEMLISPKGPVQPTSIRAGNRERSTRFKHLDRRAQGSPGA